MWLPIYYINTNAMSYVDENGNKLEYIKKQHADLHNNGLGYNFFDPTKVKINQVGKVKLKLSPPLNQRLTEYKSKSKEITLSPPNHLHHKHFQKCLF